MSTVTCTRKRREGGREGGREGMKISTRDGFMEGGREGRSTHRCSLTFGVVGAAG